MMTTMVESVMSQRWCSARVRLALLFVVCIGLFLAFDQRGLSLLENALHAVRNATFCVSQTPEVVVSTQGTVDLFELNHSSESPCTFALLRDYQKNYGYFAGDGDWNLENSPPYYQPSICKFKYPRITKELVHSCLRTVGITSVMTVGDSNALHNFEHLHRFVPGCMGTRAEGLTDHGFVPDVGYYQKDRPLHSPQEWSRYLKVHYRHCSGCAGKQVACTTKRGNETITFEHMAMTLVIDDQLTLEFGSYGEAAQAFNNVWALTTQEVYFRYFLQDRYPDVFLIFLPFNHMKHMTHQRLRLDIEYFRSLVHLYFPSTTKLFYIPTFGEFAQGGTRLAPDKLEEENRIRSGVIDQMNHDMYEVLMEELLSRDSNTYGFLDLVNVSRAVAHWSTDGQHMQYVWYEAVMSMFWETFCNSVQLDAF